MIEKVKSDFGRSYGQYCAVARGLDAVGDRWNLLIVRELLAGPLRHNELKASLGGIATNLLAERLRTLTINGVVERRLGDEGVLYALTEWGTKLREPLEALGRWAAPLMMSGRQGDAFRPRWLVTALPALLRDLAASPALEFGLEIEGSLIVVHIDETGPSAVFQPDRRPDTILTAPPEMVVGLAAGALKVDQAIAAGVLRGDVAVLRRAFPEERPNSRIVGRR